MKINNVVRFEEKNQEEKKQAQKEINNYQRDPNLSELRPGESITQYLEGNIDNNMLTRWQNALIWGYLWINNRMQADEEIYKTIFLDQWNKFNWEGGMREDEDSDEDSDEEVFGLDHDLSDSDEEVFGLDHDDENLF